MRRRPARRRATYAETISPGHCELTHATDEAYYDKIWYWATPQADCADDDAATTCKDQDAWIEAWTTLRGACRPATHHRDRHEGLPGPTGEPFVRLSHDRTVPRRETGLGRRISTWLYPRRRLQVGLLLSGPLGWLAIAYFGALFILLLSAFWEKDGFTGNVEPFTWSLDAFEQLANVEVYRTIAIRTIGMAILVTITDALLAFPIAYYMARVASPRVRGMLVVGVLLPLWAAYLVKVYAWRIVLQGNGPLDWLLQPFGLEAPGTDELANAWLVLSYLWLPYMILPIYAGPGADPVVPAGGVRRPRGAPGDDLPARGPAAGLPGARRRVDLHVLADPGRLHHARPGRGREVHRQRHLRQLEPGQPAARRRLLDAPDHHHDDLPADRTAPRRLRLAVRRADDRIARDPDRAARGERRVVLVFLYTPLIILTIYAFNPSRIMAWPPDRLHAPVVLRSGGQPERQPGDRQLADRRDRRDGIGPRARHAGEPGRPALLVLRPEHDLVPAGHPDRPARAS